MPLLKEEAEVLAAGRENNQNHIQAKNLLKGAFLALLHQRKKRAILPAPKQRAKKEVCSTRNQRRQHVEQASRKLLKKRILSRNL
jgi:hypothetical protein